MELSEVTRIIRDQNLIDTESIRSKTSSAITRVINEKKHPDTNKIDFTDANVVTSVLSEVVSLAIVNTTQEIVPAVIAACITQIKDSIKDEVIDEVMSETKDFVKESVAKVNLELTKKTVSCEYNIDKQEAHIRRMNLCFSGIIQDVREERNPTVTADKIVTELANIGCEIKREDFSSCMRIYRKNTNIQAPNLIVATFISQQVRDRVLSYKSSFNDPDSGKYVNEDMTALQRKLFTYLRSKEDIVIKKTVGFRDGYIIYLLEKNKHATRGWSRAKSALDLTDDLAIDYNNNELLNTLGLGNCTININLD